MPRLAFAVLCSVLATPATTPCYPIPPQPLRSLVSGAERIVVATVSSVRPVIPETDDSGVFGGEFVELTIERCLKGECDKAVVLLSDSIVCPIDAHYRAGSRVLAFLAPEGPSKLLQTQGRSYGAKVLSGEALRAYVEQIGALLSFSKEPDATIRRAKELEWMVATAERAPTRWEGAYEFCAEERPHHEAASARTTQTFAEISPDQRKRLLAALLASDSIGPGERCLETCFAGESDERLRRWLVDRIRELAAQPAPDGVALHDALIRLIRRDPRPALQRQVESVRFRLLTRDHDEDDRRAFRESIAAVLALCD